MRGKSDTGGVLSDKYTVPPFSILDVASGPWQELKGAWLRQGIRSEKGRGENLLDYSELILQKGGNGTSVFDPVLCELMYKWFAPSRGQVVDPFAGGSVRGIVAGALGYKYWGCDLSEEQIKENLKQAEEINKIPGALRPMPEWVVGDSRVMLDDAPEADFLFSCPPYGDKEEYSDEGADLSAMGNTDFMKA